jgi:DNA-binding protein WhiA
VLKRARALAETDATSHCRSAFLRGRILSRGSLSLASGRIHLELVLTRTEAGYVVTTLAAEGMSGVYRVRRGRGVIVWKDRTQILDLLRRLGAGSSIAEIEARGVVRQIRGDLNRTVNAETANLRRAVRAGMRQARAAAALISEGSLPPGGVLQRVSSARLAHPEATIAELGETLSLSRSIVQRALATIERQAAALQSAAALP